MPSPFHALEYLYVGTADFEGDVAYYRDVLGGTLLWNLEGFGAHVAAFRLGAGPLVLLADHRPSLSCMPLFSVADLKASAKELRKRGWKPEGRPFEIPNGPGDAFNDPSGNRLGLFQNDRPRPFE